MANEILIALFALQVILAIVSQVSIQRNKLFRAKFKFINSILIWKVPFSWSFVVINTRRSKNLEVVAKESRSKCKNEQSDNWMHLTGGGD